MPAWIRAAAVSIPVVIVCLALVEVISRAFSPPGAATLSFCQPDETFHHVWRPGLVYYDRSRIRPYTLYINRQGLVEQYDVEEKKPPNTYRIFFVGDSNTVGVVDPEYKLVEIIERDLNAIYKKNGTTIEAVNAGVLSWSILQYYLLCKYVIPKFSADLVVIILDMNDVPGDHANWPLTTFDENGDPVAVRSVTRSRGTVLTPFGEVELPWPQRLRLFLRQHSSFVAIVERAMGPRLQPADMRSLPHGAADWLVEPWPPDVTADVQRSMGLLGRLIDMLQAQGVKVLVTAVPYHMQYTGEVSSLPHEVIGETVIAHGGLYINSYEALESRIKNTPVGRYYWDLDPVHFSEEGNRVWAKALLDFMLEHKAELLP